MGLFDTIVPPDTVFSTQLLVMMSLASLLMSVAESAAMDGAVMIVPYVCNSIIMLILELFQSFIANSSLRQWLCQG